MSGRFAISSPAVKAAPEDIPTGMPSVRASRRALAIAASFDTLTTPSNRLGSMLAGMKPAPMPWMMCGPGAPPERTGLPSGSTANICRSGFFFFSVLAVPVNVPPVPTPQTTASTAPPVSRQISSAVVTSWIAGLAGLSNWLGMTEPGISASNSFALASAPFMPFSFGVRWSSAPSSASILRRSIDMDSGMVRIRR